MILKKIDVSSDETESLVNKRIRRLVDILIWNTRYIKLYKKDRFDKP